jgi:hypothetical protein
MMKNLPEFTVIYIVQTDHMSNVVMICSCDLRWCMVYGVWFAVEMSGNMNMNDL